MLNNLKGYSKVVTWLRKMDKKNLNLKKVVTSQKKKIKLIKVLPQNAKF